MESQGSARPFGLGGRRSARERALELLYEAEVKGQTLAEVIDALPLPPDTYARILALGVGEHGTELDQLLEEASHRWRLSRMPAVDRALLRLATFELAHRPEIPVAVILSEAVELAGQFSTEASGRFVNGVLSRLARQLRPTEAPPSEAPE